MRVLRHFSLHLFIMTIIKQSAGIDVSKNDFYIRLLRQEAGQDDFRKHRGVKKFLNTPVGFIELDTWLKKYTVKGLALPIAMEATGVYHEELAYFLKDKEYHVSIELPTKVKAFAKSLNQQSKTDEIDADVIAQLSFERSLREWTPPTKSMRQLKALTRQHQAITEAKTVTKNQLHAVSYSAFPMKKVLKRYEQIIKLQEEQLDMIEKEIKRLAKGDAALDRLINLLTSIPGVALKTASAIIAETGGFQLFASRSQLIKYAGMDIKSKTSGTSIRGRSAMSKAGNSRIRRALHMPSLQYVNREDMIGQLYSRVLDRTKIKMKALVAVQRKLLIIMYTVVKSGVPYDSELHRSRSQNIVGEPKLAYSDSMD